MSYPTEDAVREIDEACERDIAARRALRDQQFREAVATGRWRQSDIVRITGRSREFLRKALRKPEGDGQ